MKRVLVIGCAAPPVLQIGELIDRLESEGLSVSVVLTPVAAKWMDPAALSSAHHVPVDVEPRLPREHRRGESSLDAVILAPATFNTINKWAFGAADTLALSILCEALGAGKPIQVIPCVKKTLRQHPAFTEHVQRLKDAGVVFTEPEPFTERDTDGLLRFVWARIPLDVLSRPVR